MESLGRDQTRFGEGAGAEAGAGPEVFRRG